MRDNKELLLAERNFLEALKINSEGLRQVKKDILESDGILEEANKRYDKYCEEWEEEKERYIFQLDNPGASMEDTTRRVLVNNNPDNIFQYIKFRLKKEKLFYYKEVVVPSDYTIYKQNKEKQRTYSK